jgi:hypothetical protein
VIERNSFNSTLPEQIPPGGESTCFIVQRLVESRFRAKMGAMTGGPARLPRGCGRATGELNRSLSGAAGGLSHDPRPARSASLWKPAAPDPRE